MTKAEKIAQLTHDHAELLAELSGKVTIGSSDGIGSLTAEVTPNGLVQFHSFVLPKLDRAGCERLCEFLRDVHSEV